MKKAALSLAFLVCMTATSVAAAMDAPAKPLTAADRRAVIAELGTRLQTHYVFPDVAARVARQLQEKDASGGYAQASDVNAFAEALTADLQTLGKDMHFQANFDPQFSPPPTEEPKDVVPDSKEMEFAARRGFGIESVQRLPGNVGYLEVRAFGPTEVVGQAMSGAMLLLSGTDALILDLRRNGGGDPATVAHLLSHFFALGDARHLNSIHSRIDDTTRQYWTSNAVMPRYIKPVYVLTSKRTFSGGEECAYDFQTQKRGTLVGEITGGGANPGDVHAIGRGFVAFIPDGQAINPITRTSWEHVGVKPDIAVPAAQAQATAHAAILRELIAKADDAEHKSRLEETLAELQKQEQPHAR